MEYYWILAAIFLLIGGWNLMIAILGLFPKCRETAVGTLEKPNVYRNVPAKHGRIIPILTKYVYTYTVKGRLYRYTREDAMSERRLFKKATMVYVKGFPRHAYPNKFTGEMEWIFGLLFFLPGLYFLFCLG